jgi:hypothetical protein
MFAVFFVTCRLVVPRYVAWYLPLLLVAFLAALLLNRVSERQVQAALLVLLILCGVNAGGRAWAQLPESWQRSGELLERSREYLDDAEDCRRVARFLEYEGQGRPIIAIWPLVQMLTQPELGYVTRPLPVHAYDMFQLTYARTGRVGRLSEAQLKAALVVHSPNVFDTLAPWTLRPRDWDRILYRDRFGSDAIVVYQFGDRSDAPEQ